MADMSGKVRAEFDAAAAVTLRDLADGAEGGADTDAETGVALNKLSGAYWDNGEIPNGLVKFNYVVQDVEFGAGETYTMILEVCEDAAGTGAVEIDRFVVPAGVGDEGDAYFERYVSSDFMKAVLSTGDFVRVKCTKTGAGADITYGCWMTYHGHV